MRCAILITMGMFAVSCTGATAVQYGSGGTVAGSGGTSTGSGGRVGSGGAIAGSGGKAGAGGSTAGSGGKGGSTTGSGGRGGSNTGSGGATTGSGGTTTGSGGATAGSGGITGSGGTTGSLCASAFFSSTAAGQKAAAYKAWKDRWVKPCTNGGGAGSSVVVNAVDNSGAPTGGVFSEGIGYGMLLAANNDDQDTLKRLWQFYQDHLDAKGLMNWTMGFCAAPGNNNANAATDGDLDVAMALLLADRRWGGYSSQALNLIQKIWQHETDSCPNGIRLLRPGDVWGGCSDNNNLGKTNPSYFAPAYYREFAKVDSTNAAGWQKLATDSYTLLAQYQAAMTGDQANLVPEWGYHDGRIDGGYGYNACRTPWRVATDYMWNCTAEAKTFLQKISTYVDGKGGPGTVPFDRNSAYAGAFADSGVAISQAKIDAYVTSWMTAAGASGWDDTPYFQGTLRPLYLLVAGGQFARQ